MADPIKTGATDEPEGAFSASEPQRVESGAIRFTLQEELFFFCCLMLFTCFFLPWSTLGGEVTPWNRFSAFDSVAGSIGWSLFLIINSFALWSVTRPRLRPWF